MNTQYKRLSLVLSLITVVVLIPLTVFLGVYTFGDRKYYLISILIICEIFIPFIFAFEKRISHARELVIISVLSATAVAGRIAFAAIPNVKPFLAVIILTAIYFGKDAGFLAGAVAAFVSNFYFTQGPWTPWQMIASGLVGYLAAIILGYDRFKKSKLICALVGFLLTVIIYGGISNISSLFMFQDNINLKMIISYIGAGLSVDLIHGASTAIFIYLALIPMGSSIERIKLKYDI